jgi:hypothetical protein
MRTDTAVARLAEGTPLLVPANLDDGQARLYYPVTYVGAATREEVQRTLADFVGHHPALRRLHERYAGGRAPIEAFLAHAHHVRVLRLDRENFTFRPCIPSIRPDGTLLVGEPIELEVVPDQQGEVDEYAGLTVGMCLAYGTPLLPESRQAAVNLRSYVDRFFHGGVPTPLPGKPTIRPGASLPAIRVAQVYSAITQRLGLLVSDMTSVPADNGGVIEIPGSGSVLLLGADGAPAGQERLFRVKAALDRLGYRPFLVRALPDLPKRNVIQKAATFALACEYVLVDDSESSGHLLELVDALRASTIPFVVLRPSGNPSTAMVQPFLRSYRWCRVVAFDGDIAGAVDRAIDVAKQVAEEKWGVTLEDEIWRTR